MSILAVSRIALLRSTKAVIPASLLFTFISGAELVRANSSDGTDQPSLIVRTIRLGAESSLAIQTTPKATCMLYADEADKAKRYLRLDADDAGIVRVHARPGSITKSVKLNLDCQNEKGSVTQQRLEVRAVPTLPAITEALQPEVHVSGTPRPALESYELALSNQELLKRGYPPRPDQAIAPAVYAHWLKIVSRPFTAVSPRMVARPRFTPRSPTLPVPPPDKRTPQAASPTLPLPPPLFGRSRFDFNSGIWSGAMVTDPDVKFWHIQADWALPAVQAVPDYIGYAAAAEWIGLDNAGNDLVQAGSDSESYSFFGFYGDWTFTNYSLWVESLPDSAYFLPNFPVSPGDQISVDIFLADQNGNTTFYYGDLTPSDNNVWFMMYDLTTHQSFWGTLPKPDAFSGSSAEYVVERPVVNGSTAALANYGIAGMHDCWFADSWFGYSSLDYNGTAPNVGTLNRVTMFNSGDGNTLSSAYIYPNFSTPGGGNILFVWQNYF